jgi:hypothetical protein
MRGGEYDRWDLEVRGGLFGATRLLAATEEHGAGKQLVRFRLWPKCSTKGLGLFLFFATLTVGAGLDQAWHSAGILGGVVILLVCRMFKECAGAMATLLHALKQVKAGKV